MENHYGAEYLKSVELPKFGGVNTFSNCDISWSYEQCKQFVLSDGLHHSDLGPANPFLGGPQPVL